MTIAQANAANVIARDALNLAKNGVPIAEDVRHAIGELLNGARKKLMAGHDGVSFDFDLRAIGVRNARRERRKAARVL